MKPVWSGIAAVVMLAGAGCGGGPQGGQGGGFSVQVRTAAATREPVEERISVVASLSANEMVDIRSRMTGSIEEINFSEGERVEEGRLLFHLDKGKLEASIKEAEARFRLAKANLERARSMLENRTISRQEFDQATATHDSSKATLEWMKQQLEDSRIYATFEGVTGARLVSLGQVVTPQTLLTILVDADPIKVEFRVPERFVGQLAKGQTIEFKVPAYAEAFRGSVYFIDPQVDPATRTVLVKAEAPNPDERLRPGMFGSLDLILRVKEDAVVIPEAALVLEADRVFVYTVGGDGAVARVMVEPGARMPGKVEVLNGLQPGDRVVVEGTQKVRPGATAVEAPASPEDAS